MTAATNPRRPDLVHVAPLYYPIIEQQRFGSVEAMCKRFGWSESMLTEYVQRARVEGSDFVVIDRLVLGDPDNKVCAVLFMRPGGPVVLCGGLFAEADTDRAAVESLCRAFAESPEFRGKFIGIGAFRPNPRGYLQ